MTSRLAARTVGRLEPGTDEWIAHRTHRIGGSDIAAVMGISPWESPFSLWHRKRGEVGPTEQTDAMRWGNLLEPVVAAHFAELHPEYRVRASPTYVHRERDYQTGAPDRLCRREDGRLAIYEGKTAHVADGWGEPDTDEIPVHYRAQCLWYLDTLGLDVCHVAVLIGGSDYREYIVRESPDEAAAMRHEAHLFVVSLDAGLRPAIDSHAETYQVVKELHPDIDGSFVEVDSAVADGYLDACDNERAAKDAKRRAAALLADAMGNAREAWADGRKIALRVPGADGAPPHLRPAARKATAA